MGKHKKNDSYRRLKTVLVNSAKQRARAHSLPFSLTRDDIEIPEYCPVFGIKLQQGTVYAHDAAPSIDRLVPELGYVPENIRIISARANRLRSDATLKELKSLVSYVERFEFVHESKLKLEDYA